MACKCGKGKAKALNNLKSKDHLKVAYDYYHSTLKQKTLEQMDDLDKVELKFVFSQIYPNASITDNYELMIQEISFAAQQYK